MMMDELELLKKDWQKKDEHLPKLSYDEIHKMTWKKSSSIVKWILTISILEFTLPQLLYLLPSMKESMEVYENMGLKNAFFATSIISYTVVIYFIYQFYKRYKEISVLDDSRSLMKKIIKTRKTVKYYVLFSLSMILVIVAIFIIGIYLNENIMGIFPDMSDQLKDISPEKLKMSIMIALGIVGILLTLFMGTVYFLLYGLLLRKLNKNYADLKRLEV